MEKLPKALEAALTRVAKLYAYLPTVVVASNYQLSRPSHVNRLAIAAVELGLPRRQLTHWIASVIALHEGRIVWGSGAEFRITETMIEEVFDEEGDPSHRWVGDFYKFAVTPPKQAAQQRVIDRLRLIDLAFRIAYPTRAELIAA